MINFTNENGIRGEVYLDTRTPKKFESLDEISYPVKYRLYFDKKYIYFKANIDLMESDWQALPIADKRNKRLAEIRAKLQTGLKKLENVVEEICKKSEYSHDRLLKTLKGGRTDDIFQAFKNKIELLEKEGRINTAQSYTNTVGSLWRFINGYEGKDTFFSLFRTDAWLDEKFKRLTVKEMNIKLIQDYKEFLKHEGKSTATVGIYLRSLRSILNDLEVHPSKYPFGKGKEKIPKGRRRRNALTKENISALLEYPLNGNKKLYRDLWLFTYLGYGMNLKDVFRLKKTDAKGRFIEFIRAKTENATEDPLPIRVFMHSQLQRIIQEHGCNGENEYIFPFFYSGITPIDESKILSDYSSRIRKAMKSLAKELDLDVLPTVNALRHSFSTIAEEMGTRQTMIKVCMGHALDDVTEGYQGGVKDEELEKLSNNLL